jgi:Icc-related predicted phosphoesterase
MRVLAISDSCNTNELLEVLEDTDIDIVFTLGNLQFFDLAPIEQLNVPKFGVRGLDDKENYFLELGIQDNHLKLNSFNFWNKGERWEEKYSVFGFEGANKDSILNKQFDQGSTVQYSEYEAKQYLEAVSQVFEENEISPDFFIAHSPARGTNEDTLHKGFNYFEEFIEKHKPKYFFHGCSFPGSITNNIHETQVFYVSGIKIVDLST